MKSSFRSLVPVLVLAFGLTACSGNVCKKWE
jgi:predicted small lipoprotein YifL